MTCKAPNRTGQVGSSLVLVMLVLAAMLVIGTAFLTVSLTESRIVDNEVRARIAFDIADGGLTHAVAELTDTDIDALLASGGNLFSNRTLGRGDYTVTVTNNVAPEFPRGAIPADPAGPASDSDGILVVTSTGRHRSANRTVRVISRREGDARFAYAVFADTDIVASGNALVTGNVCANQDVNLAGGALVDGDACAGQTVNRPGNVTGTVTDGAPAQSFPLEPCPAGGYGPAPGGPGVTFDPGTGDIRIDANHDIVWPAGVSYFHDFEKSGNGRISVPAGGSVDIYVSGALSVTGAGFLNPNHSADNLQIWGCGPDASQWTLEANNNVWMTIYAPLHGFRLAGNGTVNGSLVVQEMDWSGNGRVDYDTGLTGGPFVRVPRSWTELIR